MYLFKKNFLAFVAELCKWVMCREADDEGYFGMRILSADSTASAAEKYWQKRKKFSPKTWGRNKDEIAEHQV